MTCMAALLLNGTVINAAELSTPELRAAHLDAVNPRNLFISLTTNDPLKDLMPPSLSDANMLIIDQAEANSKVITPELLNGPTKCEPIVLEPKPSDPVPTNASSTSSASISTITDATSPGAVSTGVVSGESASDTSKKEVAMLEPALIQPAAVTVKVQEVSQPALQAEVHKQVQAAIGDNGILSDGLALALPIPYLFRTLEEQANFLAEEAPIVVDNDETVEVEATIKYKDMPTDGGKTKIITGAKFPVVVSSQINSKTAKQGDPFEARLKYDLKIGDRIIAKKGAVVNGHLNYVLRARSTMHSLISPERWYRNSGCLGVSFDELINEKGEHVPLVATPAQTARIIKNKGEGRVLGVNHNGQVVGPWSQQLRYKAIRIGLDFALGPLGVFSFGAMPVALGLIGAANPSFAFTKPVGLNVRHRRIKGFAWGFLSGIPGSWIIEDTVIKGQEAIIKPGDEFLVEFKEEFTGEPATEADLIAGAKAKVHGQVVPKTTKKKKVPQA